MTSEENPIVYSVVVCGYCRHQARWDSVTRLTMGWYCNKHRDKSNHPQSFHGYLEKDEAQRIKCVPGAVRAAEEQDFYVSHGSSGPQGKWFIVQGGEAQLESLLKAGRQVIKISA